MQARKDERKRGRLSSNYTDSSPGCVCVCCYLTCIRALFPFTHSHAHTHAHSHSYTVGKYTITISKKFLLHFDTKRRRVLLVVALVIVVTPCLCDTLIMPYHTHTHIPTHTFTLCALIFFNLRSIAANVAVDVAATQEATEQQQHGNWGKFVNKTTTDSGHSEN